MKRKNSQESQIAELQKQIQFLQDELEGKTLELSSKVELIKVFSERERQALEKKELYNKESLQYKQENQELLQVMEGMKREKKELIQIYEAKKKQYEDQMSELTKQLQGQSKKMSKISGKLDLEEDIFQLHNTIRSKEEVVQILNEDINLQKSNILRLEKQLQELKDDNIELHQQNLLFKQECDQRIQKLREDHLYECSNFQEEIEKLVDKIRDLSNANKQQEQKLEQYQKIQFDLEQSKINDLSDSEIVQELRQKLEDVQIEKEIQTNKYNNELKCLKEIQKDLIQEKEILVKKCEEQENQIKQLQDKCDQQSALIKLRQVQQQQQQQPQQTPPASNSHSNNIDPANLKREKKILEALSARVQDLSEENQNLKQSIQDQSAINNQYEQKLKQKSQIILNIIQEIRNTYPQISEQKIQEISEINKEVIQSFKSYSMDDLFSLVEDLFIENQKTKQQIRDVLLKQQQKQQSPQ
ncbi:hypothetical protein TTHERM_00079810 (macronuclear) [Tetrahymena thermophila SB210]|uniref:Uncharacterized protein n=1 Tax=Tetrahymena thermophila (strain SB210) TaxID=312017 RepID=Q23FN4_TETTS|nr:hypothetical protein TTHERM_00079810 [Tetrahymena thermophila SB210]EAR95576.2 hypothetical protein TTHERM_00079810 [Tetrahymena thermophila SB210]|eukprot:XP_001015821.2 hypothetical protein TTHERM_00079810 [Tetrahymena thermophila SB210]